MEETLEELFAVIEDRKETLPEDSYTASLFTHEKGENAVLEKLGEESTELIWPPKTTTLTTCATNRPTSSITCWCCSR